MNNLEEVLDFYRKAFRTRSTDGGEKPADSFSVQKMTNNNNKMLPTTIFNRHNTHVWSSENPHALFGLSFTLPFFEIAVAGVLNDRWVARFILANRYDGTEY